MITIYFNEQTYHCESQCCLGDFLTQNPPHEPCFAIALNNQLIPRQNYPNTPLHAGDRISLIIPMQGG